MYNLVNLVVDLFSALKYDLKYIVSKKCFKIVTRILFFMSDQHNGRERHFDFELSDIIDVINLVRFISLKFHMKFEIARHNC